jgi:hypothetical protein
MTICLGMARPSIGKTYRLSKATNQYDRKERSLAVSCNEMASASPSQHVNAVSLRSGGGDC